MEPNHLSILGIIHTAFSIVALLAAFYALFRSGRIAPATAPGKWYIWLTIITCLTSLPIMKTGHITVAHYVAITILVLIPLGVYIKSLRIFGKLAGYVQIFFLSTTIFLSCIPAIVETLTRIPISGPLASGPNDPIIQKCTGALVLLYFVGMLYQMVKQWSSHKKGGQQWNSAVN
jgi:hypothetical protein